MTMDQPSPLNRASLDDMTLLLTAEKKQMETFLHHLEEHPVEVNFPSLTRNLKFIGSIFPNHPIGHPRYLEQWSEYLTGRPIKIDKHTLRYLCWEAKIATTEQFLVYLQKSNIDLTGRPLAGIVRSCHLEWNTVLANPHVIKGVKDMIRGYTGHSPVILKWKSNIDAIIESNGPDILGEALVDSEETIISFFDEWYLDAQSPFVHHVVEAAMNHCRTRLAKPTHALLRKLFGELLQWSGWKPQCLREEITRLILHDTAVGQTREILQRFIMAKSHYGDPRIEANRAKWRELSPAAMKRVLLWLSENPFSLLERTYREGIGWKVNPHPEAQDIIRASAKL
jgi:hypothetical protein